MLTRGGQAKLEKSGFKNGWVDKITSVQCTTITLWIDIARLENPLTTGKDITQFEKLFVILVRA